MCIRDRLILDIKNEIDESEKLITASTIMSENKINSLLVVNAVNDFVGVVQMYDLGL